MNEPDTINPYAAPAAEIISPPALRLARIEKKMLVVPKDWQAPPVCFLTGTTEDLLPPRRKRLAWLHPAWLLLFLLLRLISLLVLVFLQKRGKIYYQLNRAAAARQRKKLLINWGIFLTGVGLSVIGYKGPGGTAILISVGGMLILLSGVLAYTMCRTFYARRIAGNFIWLGGVRREVMEEIVRLEEQRFPQIWPDPAAPVFKQQPSFPPPLS